MPIYGVALIPRRCDVLDCTTHSSGFRAPCIWTFLNSLRNSHLNGSLLLKEKSLNRRRISQRKNMSET